jgi:2',3'-cyclic-nucleotide 2'-phosphodiesterase (5'-nucleotidase family)
MPFSKRYNAGPWPWPSPRSRWPLCYRPDQTTDVRLITLNDFHGNLEPPSDSSGRVSLPDGTKVDAGCTV